jgi:hypothetical protein
LWKKLPVPVPDRDTAHDNIPPNYQDGYHQLQEGLGPQTVARKFERGLKERLKHYGDAPVSFLQKAKEEVGDAQGPLLFRTKSEMCRSISDIEGAPEVASSTITCDSKPRKKYDGESVRHCGLCSSCILRRLSLAATGFEDQTRYAVCQPGYDPGEKSRTHLRAMQAQARRIRGCLEDQTPWKSLASAYTEPARDVRPYVLDHPISGEAPPEPDVASRLVALQVGWWPSISVRSGLEAARRRREASDQAL